MYYYVKGTVLDVRYTNDLKENTMVMTENIKWIFMCLGKKHLYNMVLTSYITLSNRRFDAAVVDQQKLDAYF